MDTEGGELDPHRVYGSRITSGMTASRERRTCRHALHPRREV